MPAYPQQWTLKQIAHLFSNPDLPKLYKEKHKGPLQKNFTPSELSDFGAEYGFLPRLHKPMAVTVFTTKGGVLKSTIALNLARLAALHNMKTLVIGLDIQGDVTTALGHGQELEEVEHLDEALKKIDEIKGLPDFFNQQVALNKLIVATDLPKLFLIPETPELVALNDSLSNIHRREFWLKEKVIDPLKEHFDLIIMDCSPNWNRLTTNALVASDALISPLECKINNFRNFKVFYHFLNEFKRDMHINFDCIFIPTKYASNKRLGMEIKQWYQENVRGCTSNGVRESVHGEESTAVNRSLLEHDPQKVASREMMKLFMEVFQRMQSWQNAVQNEASLQQAPH
jgi:chromosome partitioning protein